MMHKLFFLATILAFGLNLTAIAESPIPFMPFKLHNHQKLVKSSDNSLITNACKAAGVKNEADCVSTLETAPANQKTSAKDLAFFTLKYVEHHAENVTEEIKTVMRLPEVAPMLQAALSDCAKQYNSVDDLIEDAINALLANALDDTKQFIEAAADSIGACEEELRSSNVEEKLEHKKGRDYRLARGLKDFNDFLKSMLATALVNFGK